MKAFFALGLTLATLVIARETLDEAAVHTRELLAYRSANVGVLMSKYPENDPNGLGGLPIGLQEYIAPYPGSNGDILLLGMPIAKIFRNALPPNPPNMTLTYSDIVGFEEEHGNLAAGRMRIALFGTLERAKDDEVEACEKAYLQAHPDARGWINGAAHTSFWARLRVNTVYDFGGFGDVAYIGWIPLEKYRDAGKLMRDEKEVLKDWPVPRQPGELTKGMFDGEQRFKVQW